MITVKWLMDDLGFVGHKDNPGISNARFGINGFILGKNLNHPIRTEVMVSEPARARSLNKVSLSSFRCKPRT